MQVTLTARTEAFGLLERVGYDLDLMSPRLLGHDVRRIAGSVALDRAVELLNDVRKSDMLEIHMTKELNHADDPLATAQTLITQFRLGLEDR
jgi:predicted nucleotidyltransferase